jgi:hypothetical protein
MVVAVPSAAQEFRGGLDNSQVRVSRIAPDAPVAQEDIETDVLTDTLWIDILMSGPGVDVTIKMCTLDFSLTNLILANGGSIETFTVAESLPGPVSTELPAGVHTRIVFPDPGDQRCLRIHYELQPGVEEEVAAIATIHSDSPNRSALIALPQAPVVGQPVSLTLAWYFDDAPLSNSTVTAQVYEPDGDVRFLAMRNDGVGADAEAGDALFSASFTPREAGLHVIKAMGQTNSLKPSLTEALAQVDVQEAPLTIRGPLAVAPVDENANGFYEAVEVVFEAETSVAGEYAFRLVVSGEMGTSLVQTLELDLFPGTTPVTIRVPAAEFRNLKEGPYVFGPVEARLASDLGLARAGGLSEPTELPISLADLELPEITLYGIWNDRSTNIIRKWVPNLLYRLDPETGAAQLLTSLAGPLRGLSGGAAFLRGKLYISDVIIDKNVSPGEVHTGWVDLATGEFSTLVVQGPITGGGLNNWPGLAANEAEGLLYTVASGPIGSPDGEMLLAIDLAGQITTIDDEFPISGTGLAYDDARGVLYATDAFTDSIYTVDTASGEVTLLGPAGVPSVRGGSYGLAYDESCGVLYATMGYGAPSDADRSFPDTLYTVDQTTGAFTLVADAEAALPGLAWGAEGFDGLAAECTAPPPADLRLEIAPRVEVGLLGAQRAVEATLTEVQDGSAAPREGQPVRIEVVSGPNLGAGSEVPSDAEGRAAFSYAGTGGVGVDEILVAAENDDGSPVSEVAVQFWDRDCNADGTPDACEWDCLAFDRHCTAFPACGARGAGGDGVIDACLVQDFCDVDADGDIDRDDIDTIVAARNSPATGPDDSRDADGDGAIGHLDARVCTLRCSNEGCAPSASGSGATPASSCGLGFELVVLLPVVRRLRSLARARSASRGRS